MKKGSPWSGIKRGLTNEEWLGLKAWRVDNPGLTRKRGEQREDGRLFWVYNKPNCGGEKWLTDSSFKKLMGAANSKKTRDYGNAWRRRKYKLDPQYRATARHQSKAFYLANITRAKESKKLWWRKKYATDQEFRKKALAKCAARTKKFGCYCSRDALRRVGEITGSAALIRSVYKHAALFKRNDGMAVEVDHIIPIASGGAHHEMNLQILGMRVNRIKKDNPFWMSPDGLSLDWRDVPEYLWPEHLRGSFLAIRFVFGHPLKSAVLPGDISDA